MISNSLSILSKGMFFALGSVLLTSCFDGGGSGSVSMGSMPPGSPSQISIAIDKIQTASRPSWIMDSLGKVYLKDAAVRVDGHCTRGVASVTVAVNSVVVAETAACGVDGNFTWHKTFSASTPALGTEYALEFRAMNSSGTAILGVIANQTIVVDTQAPTAPTLDPVAGCTLSTGTWVCSSASVQVAGSWATGEDVQSLQFPGSGSISYPTATSFQFSLSLTEGQSRSLDFTVKDRAGNISGASMVTVSYSPVTSALASSVNTGGTAGLAGGPVNTAPSMIGNVGTMGGKSLDLNSSAPANQRVQLIIGPVAVGAQQINP